MRRGSEKATAETQIRRRKPGPRPAAVPRRGVDGLPFPRLLGNQGYGQLLQDRLAGNRTDVGQGEATRVPLSLRRTALPSPIPPVQQEEEPEPQLEKEPAGEETPQPKPPSGESPPEQQQDEEAAEVSEDAKKEPAAEAQPELPSPESPPEPEETGLPEALGKEQPTAKAGAEAKKEDEVSGPPTVQPRPEAAVKEAEGKDAEAGKKAEEHKLETGGAEAEAGKQAPAVSPGPPAVAEGGAPPAPPGMAGGEPQVGSEEDGLAELEESLAKADPERAAADEADPAEVATGEDLEAEDEPGEMMAEPKPPEPAVEAPESTSSADPLKTAGISGADAIDTAEPAPEPEAAEPAAAEGFSGDEPALGGGALSEASDLSEPEKKAALESIGESVGGSGVPGGGGGGAAIPDRPAPKAPDVSAEEPSVGLARAGSLPPVLLMQALGGVNAAVAKTAGDQRSGLAANPPRMERPTGSSRNLHGRMPGEAAPQDTQAKPVERATEGEDSPTPEPAPSPEPPPSLADKAEEPNVTGAEGGKLAEGDVERLSSSMHALPTRDPGLRVKAGPAPRVDLAGNADPARTGEQRQKLQSTVGDTTTLGRRDVTQEMGESKIFPSVAPETLTAKVTPSAGAGAAAGGAAAGDAAAGGGGAVGQEALSFIAQQKKGGEIRAALATAQADMAARRDEYAAKVSDEKAKSAKEIVSLEARSAADQAQVRAQAQAEVAARKTEWSEEQQKTVREADQQADAEARKGRQEVQKRQAEADVQARGHLRKGDEEAARERRKAEHKAAEAKRKGQSESSGVFGWLADKAKAFFNKIKSAVKAAFDLARKAIKKAIDLAKKAAMWAIEQGRKAIVAAIKKVGKVLIAIGDRLLAAFPALRNKFRKLIQASVDKAVRKVNESAAQLKKGVSAALDTLSAGLDKLVGWLEKGALAAVSAAASVVDGAIKFAEKVAQALGTFAVLIKDVASGPIRWIKNLGLSVVDGIRNHLWKAFKEAVKEWFNSKLEQVLGLGKMIWDLIRSGGLALAKVGKMAWEGLKALIPMALIRILVEKLVAMIVPAAGAVMAIIEGLQAAWGAVQRVIAAFQAFFAFLKAVKSGGAGPKFATALAAAAVAIIDFVANWLLAKLAKGAAKIGGKIKGLARRLAKKRKAKMAAKKKEAKRKTKLAKPPKKVSKAKEKSRDRRARKRKPRNEERQRKRQEKKRQRQEKAFQTAANALRRRLQNPVGKRRLLLYLKYLKIRHRFRSLKLIERGDRFEILATFNPKRKLVEGVEEQPHSNAKFEWNPNIKHRRDVEGGLKRGALAYVRETRLALDWKELRAKGTARWHRHHPWPMWAGGSDPQPRMVIRGKVHNAVVHPRLDALIKGVSGKRKGPELRARLIEKKNLRTRIKNKLLNFYKAFPATPPIPESAFIRGIEHTEKELEAKKN